MFRLTEYEEYKLVIGDTLPEIEFDCLESETVPFDLTGWTAKFFFRKYCNSQHKNVGHEDCVIVNAVAGICKYVWQAGDISEEGVHYGELELSNGTGKLTVPTRITFKVIPQLEA